MAEPTDADDPNGEALLTDVVATETCSDRNSTMPDPRPQLTDCTVTLAGEELTASAVEFNAGEVVLRRCDWNEDG